jgi:N-ethylmaleimide reductase
MKSIFDPITIGKLSLKNRIFMAPLTRGRSLNDGTPSSLMQEYYRQRSSAGLIIAEATAVSPHGRGWLNSPGLYNDLQESAWKKVASAVHAKGGAIFVQLWHMGAAVHPDFINGEKPISSSEVKLPGQLPTPKGRNREFVTPRALRIDEIPAEVKHFVDAARRAIKAGLDGVEIHGANGFLIDQFIRDSSNRRTDKYGGSINNRLRFMGEVVDAVCQEIGSDKVAVRLSPTNKQWGISDSTYQETFTQAVQQLDQFNLAYLHIFDPLPEVNHGIQTIDYLTPILRNNYTGIFIVNGGYSQSSANTAITNGLADAVAFGVPFIANPDLVERYRNGLELEVANPKLFYTSGAQGYTDYPIAKSIHTQTKIV